jgi:phosphoglycerate kinase
MLDTARVIIDQAKASQCNIILPKDVAVASDIQAHVPRREVSIHDVAAHDKIVDIGKATMQDIRNTLSDCATVVWNGPVGIFEIPPFDVGSTSIAQNIARLTTSGKLVSVAGGGDTLAALAHAGCENEFTYTSTAGGAFLEWLEGKTLPGVEALYTSR